MIGLLSEGSTRHEASFALYESLRASDAELVLAEHTIMESFSVLSRSPEPLGLPSHLAERLIRDLCGQVTIAPFRQGLGLDAIRQTLDRGHYGGRVYDAVIALSVYEAGARLLLTWNTRHFYSIAPAGLEVREP